MTPPVRLLLWHWGRRGGGPRYTLELARALKHQDNVEVYLSVSRQCEIADEFHALDLPTLWIDTYTSWLSCLLRSIGLPVLAWRMGRYIAANRIDVIDSTMPHLWSRLLLPALRKSGARIVYTVHDATRHPGEGGPLTDWFYTPPPGADAYIALTDFVAGRMSAAGIPADRIAVVPHGVFTFRQAGKGRTLDPGRPMRLLFFGRILPYKGLDRLLAACRILHAEGHSLTLHIAGAGDLTPYDELIAGLPGTTVNQGWIAESHIPAILDQADIVVLPYTEASQSGVAPTAFAMGIPVVVTPVGGLTEQVANGADGLVSRDTSPEAIADALRQLLDNPALVAHLSTGALRTASEKLSWNNIARKIGQLCQHLVRHDPGA